jgi:hypothetical protein
MNVEEALIRAFIVPERRSRYIALLATSKKRTKLLGTFYHLHDLDPRYVHRIDSGLQNANWIYDTLRKRGAPERCYVMSASSELDGQETELRPALEEIVGYYDGTFVSCLPGRLGYFEGEEPKERYILERPALDAIS